MAPETVTESSFSYFRFSFLIALLQYQSIPTYIGSAAGHRETLTREHSISRDKIPRMRGLTYSNRDASSR